MDAHRTICSIIGHLARRSGADLTWIRISDLAFEIESAFIHVDAETISPMPGALNALAALREAQVPVAVISNHPFQPASVELVLRRCGLRGFVDNVFVSSAIGYRKSLSDPRHTIFRIAAAALQTDPPFILHVGNEHEADFEAPGKFGMHAVVCDNRASLHKRRSRFTGGSARGYADARLAAFRSYSLEKCLLYYHQNRQSGSADLEDAVTRLHEISRDIFAPVLIGFAEENLAWLAAHTGAMNLCVGRDALGAWLVQGKLIELFPSLHSKVDPTCVRYLNISRQLMTDSLLEHLSAMFRKLGIAESKALNIIDNGIVGTIQNCFHALYPDKSITGHYLLARRLRSDPHRMKKVGFLMQTDSTIHGRTITDLAVTGGLAGPGLIQTLLSSEFVHHHEDFWNGIYESALTLCVRNGELEPANRGCKMMNTPGGKDAFGCDLGPGDYILLKKIALRAIVEGVILHQKQAQLGIHWRPLEAVINYARWFKNAYYDEAGDGKLIRGLVRIVFRKGKLSPQHGAGARWSSYYYY
jgi:FMN phosphatase YigB (HAD superfamily)